MQPILCIGESLKEREKGSWRSVLENQLASIFSAKEKNFLLAYEPVWAIGTGLNARPEQIKETHQFIFSILRKNFDKEVAEDIPILYGGSVNEGNALEILSIEKVDGLLIGGASLKAEKFLQIIQLAKTFL